MKKAIIVYCSKRGSTRQYAEWLAEDLSEFCECELVPAEESKKINLYMYDLVIYGGWIRGSGIVEFDNFGKNLDDELLKKCMVFGVGIANPTPENYMQVWSLNLGKLDPKNENKATLYIFDGAYDPAKVTGFDKMLMGVCKKVLMAGSKNLASDDAQMMKDRIENGVDLVKRENLKAIVKESKKRLGLA